MKKSKKHFKGPPRFLIKHQAGCLEKLETLKQRQHLRDNPPGTYGPASECRVVMKDGKLLE